MRKTNVNVFFSPAGGTAGAIDIHDKVLIGSEQFITFIDVESTNGFDYLG